MLEKITHNEDPWKHAREGYADWMPSNVIITKESIRKYFEGIGKQYEIGTEEGLNKYIQDILKKA